MEKLQDNAIERSELKVEARIFCLITIYQTDIKNADN